VLLRHGTTRRRAEAISQNGPDASFREPGSEELAFGFSAVPEGIRPIQGTPEYYAKKKAESFPDEGGPAILELELPDKIARKMIAEEGQIVPGKAWFPGGEIRFDRDGGLAQLCTVWPKLNKVVILLTEE
jgi:hypothetical protein